MLPELHRLRTGFVFSLHVPNLWLQDCFLFRDHFLSFKECLAYPIGALRSRVDGRPGDHCMQSWGGVVVVGAVGVEEIGLSAVFTK